MLTLFLGKVPPTLKTINVLAPRTMLEIRVEGKEKIKSSLPIGCVIEIERYDI